MTIGERIRRERDRVGMSQRQLALAIGIHPNAQNRIEQDQVDTAASHIVAMAKVLGCSTDTILIGRPGESQAYAGKAARPWFHELLRRD